MVTLMCKLLGIGSMMDDDGMMTLFTETVCILYPLCSTQRACYFYSIKFLSILYCSIPYQHEAKRGKLCMWGDLELRTNAANAHPLNRKRQRLIITVGLLCKK